MYDKLSGRWSASRGLDGLQQTQNEIVDELADEAVGLMATIVPKKWRLVDSPQSRALTLRG